MMNKQEKIRKGIGNFLELQCSLTKPASKWASGFILSYLHSQGVVIEQKDDDGNIWIVPLIKENDEEN